MAESSLIATGITGLDEILLGGVPRGNVILLQGVTGSGKTLMGTEFIYRGITQFNEPGLIVVFEASPDKLVRDTAKFGWDLDELQREKKLQIIFTSPQVFDQELRSADSLLARGGDRDRRPAHFHRWCWHARSDFRSGGTEPAVVS